MKTEKTNLRAQERERDTRRGRLCFFFSLRDCCELKEVSGSMGGGDAFTAAAAGIPGARIYSCCNCRRHVADHDDIISKAFQGRNGRAYLITNVVNVTCGIKENRIFRTGLHTVADICCSQCLQVLGWKYEKAYEESEKYKEGKFILERAKVMKENW